MLPGGFIPIFNKIMGPALGLAFESSITMNRAEGKSIPKTLLDASYHFVDNKTNTKPSSLLIVSGLTLTNNEIKDIITVIKSLEKRRIEELPKRLHIKQ